MDKEGNVASGEVNLNGRVGLEASDGAQKNGHGFDQGAVTMDASDRARFVRDYTPLVHRLCRRFSGYGEPLEDLVQVGTVGLIKAIAKYDPTRGVSFMTFAVPVIVGEIKNYFRDHGWSVKVPRKLQSNKLAVQRAVDSLGQKLGRSPAISEIMEATELTREQVIDTIQVVNYTRPLSLDASFESNGNSETSHLLEFVGHDDPEFDRLNDRIDLSTTLSCLGRREKIIIYLKFYVGLSQTDIAKRLGVSQMHVSRLQRNALSKLKQRMTP